MSNEISFWQYILHKRQGHLTSFQNSIIHVKMFTFRNYIFRPNLEIVLELVDNLDIFGFKG